MPRYVALLRGIAPTNPNMRNERLREVAEGLGHGQVSTVISSGNLLFSSDRTDIETMEEEMETAWPAQLGFKSSTIIRRREQLEKLVAADPYRGFEHHPKTYLLTTFCKRPPRLEWKLPYQPEGMSFRLLALVEGVVCSVTDNTSGQTPDLMTWLDQRLGKEISSRTWLTVNRILTRMRTLPA